MPFKNQAQRRAVMAQLKNPDSKLNKFKRCYHKVEEKDESVNPYAVCRTSTNYKGTTRNIGLKHPIDKKVLKKKH